jgi:hypothetical protein
MRRVLYAILVMGFLGTGTELLLLGHYEDAWQWTPLVLIGLSLVVVAWRSFDRGSASLVAFRAVMALSAASGLLGIYLHYRGNVEFELEMTPELRGFELFAEAMTGATPALAPGAMALLGLIGFAAELRAASTVKELRL